MQSGNREIKTSRRYGTDLFGTGEGTDRPLREEIDLDVDHPLTG